MFGRAYAAFATLLILAAIVLGGLIGNTPNGPTKTTTIAPPLAPIQ